MHLTGDSLTVVATLATSALTCGVGAIAAPKGWRARALWGAAAILAIALLAFVAQPSLKLAATAVPIIYALLPLLTVSVVALIVRRPKGNGLVEAKPAKGDAAPEDRAKASTLSRWVPDMTIAQVGKYITTKTDWRPRYDQVNDQTVAAEVLRALNRGAVTAWGRAHPDSEEFQVSTHRWSHAELNRLDGYAFLKDVQTPVYGLRFAKGEVEAAWPKG